MRWGAAVAALIVGLGLAANGVATAPTGDRRSLAVLAVPGLLALLGGMVAPRSFLAALAAALLGTQYAIALARANSGHVEARAVLVGAGLLLLVELIDLAGSSPRGTRTDAAVRLFQVAWIAGTLAASLLAGLLALGVVSLGGSGGGVVRIVGMAGALAALALPVLVARRGRQSR
jgi:hypothetical protein